VVPLKTNGDTQPVHSLIVPVQLEQLGSHISQMPLIATSFVFVQADSHTLDVVTTLVPEHDVQVEVDISQVKQLLSQANQVVPLTIVNPVVQLD
jgi:hypothetical protein